MIPEKLTLKELQIRKAKDYLHRSRDRNGTLTKSFAECYTEAQEDYGPTELDAFNLWWKDHWNQLMSTANQVVWADGVYDYGRTCDSCHTFCQYPVHGDKYSEIIVSTALDEKEDEEG